ncbi:MAG: TIGR03790 family protein [Verrucomicrobiota bacterium JB023]|nr:TIGR03790 family protein [Verrucomicrobiota bacterium JB023]
MRILLLLLVTCLTTQAIEPKRVLVLYRQQDASSKALAETYAKGRNIPAENLVGLATPEGGTISREDYNTFIRDPLINLYDEKQWWRRGPDATGRIVPLANERQVILLMRGLPYRIKRTPTPKGANGKPQRIEPGKQDEASVDSELALFGIQGTSASGPLTNPYYKHQSELLTAQIPALFLTCRIDGPTVADCERMMADALAVEKTGLWGTCYLDQARKGKGYEAGDDWIRAIARRNLKEGIPTVMDTNRDTFLTNYPMTDAALYFGWYAHHRNGPLLNPRFVFKPGAIAVHLHSFSASELRNTKKRWTGPLIAAGATATLGNVWEPYLTLTHDFEIFHDRLLKGFSLVEAAHMAIPAHSWQSLVIGDPLYRPYADFRKEPSFAEDNRAYRAFRLAVKNWGRDDAKLMTKVRTAAAKMNSGKLYEALGLRLLQEGRTEQALAFFDSAERIYPRDADKLRQTLHRIEIYRHRHDKDKALELIREGQQRFADLPEAKALIGLKNILNPPAPPAAGSTGG